MAVLWVITLVIPVCLSAHNNQYCEIASVQIDHEDGSRQVFELKRIEPVKGAPCIVCGSKGINRAWEATPLRFSVVVTPGEVVNECDTRKHNLPAGLCATQNLDDSCSNDDKSSCSDPQVLANTIVEQGLVPMATGDLEIDKGIALAVVLVNLGLHDRAIHTFTEILQIKPKTVAAFYGRGVAYARKGLNVPENAVLALSDFTEAILIDKKRHEAYERRAEVYIGLGQYNEALSDLSVAIKHRPTEKLYFMRGVIHLLLENFADAETDFKQNVEAGGDMHIMSYFNLGLAQYYRGRVRNAIEVFKEILKLKPDHIDACTSLAQAFKEIGNLKAARSRFNQSLALDPNHSLSLQLQGSMMYHSGDPRAALKDFNKCLKIDPDHIHCQYMQSLSYVAIGKIYEGVKASTKVMIKNQAAIKMSPEFIKAHYLREYGRYLHSKLDSNLDQLHPEYDLSDEFQDHWVKTLPFSFKKPYLEQPGLQPDIRDVNVQKLLSYTTPIQSLLCRAEKIGWYMQVNSDGYTPNKRLNLAMGLASIHIAQFLEMRWKSFKNTKGAPERPLNWRELFGIAVQYRRLVDPEQPVLWVTSLPDFGTAEGYRTDITFIRGSVANLKVMPYFDLVFKLAKTMLEHYSGEGSVSYAKLNEDINKAKTCEDLLSVARKRKINPHGFLVSTQVPSMTKVKEEDRLDGAMLILTEDLNGKIVFALNVANTQERMSMYSSQLDYVLGQIQDEIRKTGLTKITDIDQILNLIVSLVYYFYNLMPLTRGSSVVAYTVALGLMMSLGRQVTGKIPAGKLLELEAMLAGAPDAFVLVSKQWMNIKKTTAPVSSFPRVWEVFPTVRHVLEVLTVNTSSC